MRHQVLRRWLLPVAGVFALGASCGRQGAEPLDSEIAELLQQLESRGSVRVVVALGIPAADSLGATDLEGLQRLVAQAQDEVLASLDPTGFRDPERPRSVPSMTLTLLTEAAVRALARHPAVEKIGLDVGGVGHYP